MSDPIAMARGARESLARGLSALQGDPNVPPHLLDLGQPIAQAMGALYKIEASAGAELQPHVQTALSQMQGALGKLQAQPAAHPAVAVAMEAVAGALGSVHALSRMTLAQPPTAPQGFHPLGNAAPAAQPKAVQVTPAPAPVATGAPAVAHQPPAGDVPSIVAELGAHSPSNFYKGLSGNDIVDHGGLFVSTYKIPKIGSHVRLRVSMPGGYEFEANGVVRWRREPNDASTDAPPGFGAQFTDITTEARQLVYRYVRNREPLFHDDL